jgi:hypothetical protein
MPWEDRRRNAIAGATDCSAFPWVRPKNLKIEVVGRKIESLGDYRRSHPVSRRCSGMFVSTLRCVAPVFLIRHRRPEQHGDASMKRERITFEMEAETRSTLETWAREEDRSIGSLLRRIVEKAAQERRAAAASEAR